MTELPRVAVLPTKFVSGLSSVNQETSPPLASIVDFESAFSTRYATDAHFVTYLAGDGTEEFPRLNKSCLAELEGLGVEVVTTMLVLDYDNPGHAEWTREALEEFVERVVRHPKAVVRDYTVMYTTLHGARLVYVLERPVPVLEGELRLQSLVGKFHSLGINVDKSTKDWTRLFRLPSVRRDTQDTWEHPLFFCDVQAQNRLALDAVPALGKPNVAPAYVRVDEEQPTPEEAEALLNTMHDGRSVRTAWAKEARKALIGRECFPCIFEGEAIASAGMRNPTIMSMAGQVVSLLFPRTGTTPQKCYALLLPAVMQLDGDDGGRSWPDTLWHAISHAWSREAGRAKEAEQKAVETRHEILTAQQKLLAGVRTWAEQAGYKGSLEDEEALWAWTSERMILCCAGSYFVMRPDGFYARTPSRKDTLSAALRRERMDDLIHFWDERTDQNTGETFRVERPTAKIISDHLTPVDYVEGRANLPGSILARSDTGQLVLTHSIYSIRPDLVPTYNELIDEWLHALTGNNYSSVINWIAHALDFTRPICAMSVVGPPSCGKGMMIQGLAECITSKSIVPGDELVSDYQYEIQRSPFLVIDEGFPKAKFGRDAADNFRRWVGGGSITVNAKFQVPLKVQSPMRVLIAANNNDVIRTITQGRTLSIEDRDAIAMRIFHWVAEPSSGRWLSERGGFEFTKGWIDSPDGAPGTAALARHFLWLHKMRTPAPPGRFLVEGRIDAEVVQDMALESGIMLDVIETIIAMLGDRSAARRGLHIDDETGSIYVLSNSVVDYWNKVMRPKRAGRGMGLHHRSVAQALRTLTRAGWREGVHRIGDQQARWALISNQMLLRAAMNNGFDSEKLLALIEAEQGVR